jgi:hypothetical protein
MRPVLATIVATVAALLFLVGCTGDQTSPTPPATVPDVIAAPSMASSAARSTPLDPSHTYRFAFACSAGAGNSIVHITNDGTIGSINVACNSSTELGAAYGSTFSNYGVDITLSPSGKLCSQTGVTFTGTYRCKAQKYSATLTVSDEGVLPTP